MLEKLIIRNFQSHKKTALNFSEGINVIVGPSDNGKSAIYRAMRWLITNRPTGTSFVSHWNIDFPESTKVKAVFSEGRIIRERSKNFNGYHYFDGEIDKAVKTDVPERVEQFLNISEINMQSQFDPSFLVGSSGGEIARFFNKIIGLDEIDDYLRIITKMKKSNSSLLEVRQKDLEKVTSSLEELCFIADAQKYRKRILNILKHIESIEKEKLTINENLEVLNDNATDFSFLEKAITACQKINEFKKEITETKNELSQVVDHIEEYNEALNLDFSFEEKANEYLGHINSILQQLEKIYEQNILLKNLISDFMIAKEIVPELEIQITNLKKRMPETCVFCGGRLKK